MANQQQFLGLLVMGYLSLIEFRDLTVMPAADVNAVETAAPGWIQKQLDLVSDSEINSRLRKRYDAPFAVPYPPVVKDWLQRIVTPRVFLRRGVDPSDAQMSEVIESAKLAIAQLKEAADADSGLYDLPLRADTTASGVSHGGPLGYSESDPYTWTDIQAGFR